MSCSNPKCKKSLSFFKKKIKCIGCNLKFCLKCGTKDPGEIENLKKGGWCWDCFINQNEHTSIEKRTQDTAEVELKESILNKNFNFLHLYEKKKTLYLGSKSTVFKVKCIHSGKYFALKQIFKQHWLFDQAQKEFLFSFQVKSDYLVRSFECFRDENCFYILYELMEMTLETFFKKFRPLKESLILHIVNEIVKGIEFIHYNNRIHRDLKPSNIFIDKEGRIKLGDFGEIGEIYSDSGFRKTILGSPMYMAPEILKQSDYNFLVDIWSLGIIIVELTDSPLYKQQTFADIMKYILNGERLKISSNYSNSLIELVQNCLQTNYELRPNARQILNHKYFREAKNKRNLIKTYINRDMS